MSKKSRIAQSEKRKRKPIDLNKTLEQIDGQDWGEPTYDSNLVITCHKLRKKKLIDFTIEDLRILIGQDINLEVLIPMAIPKLEENILAEGDFYEGDLLKAVMSSESSFWKENKDYWLKVKQLYEAEADIFDCSSAYRDIVKSFVYFSSINS